MHTPRFFLTPEDLTCQNGSALAKWLQGSLDLPPGCTLELINPNINKQIVNVLRMKVQDKLVLLNGQGGWLECIIENIKPKSVACNVIASRHQRDDNPTVTVGLALLKGERFDWALQKLTELGAYQIVPLLTERTVVKIDASDAKAKGGKLTRWNAILKEAAEQSERPTIPHLMAPQRFAAWLTEITGGGTSSTTYICAERIQSATLKDILLQSDDETLNHSATTGTTINLVIGPEGGFTKEELDIAQELGAKPVSLGKRILRSETAAIFALAQVIWCLEK